MNSMQDYSWMMKILIEIFGGMSLDALNRFQSICGMEDG